MKSDITGMHAALAELKHAIKRQKWELTVWLIGMLLLAWVVPALLFVLLRS